MSSKGKSILKSVLVILLFLTFSSLFFIIFNIDKENITDKEYLNYLVISNILLMGIFIYIYRKDLIKDLSYFKKNFEYNFFNSFKYWLIGFVIMFISNLIITFILKLNIAGNETEVRNFININPILMILIACIISPVTEELTFRKSIKDACNNKWIYIIVSGFVFGLLHVISYINASIDLVYLVPYTALGISFALLYYKTNNIYSTISMHAMHNTLSIIIYLLGAKL